MLSGYKNKMSEVTAVNVRRAAPDRRRTWLLPMVLMLSYLIFFATFAFAPELLGGGERDDAHGLLTWGLPVALGSSFLAFVLAGMHVNRVRAELLQSGEVPIREIGQ